MYQVPAFRDRNYSSFVEVAGKAVAVGWYEKPILEHAHFFLSFAALNLTPDYKLFPFCDFSVVGCGGTELHDQFCRSVHLLSVSMLGKLPLPSL